ncbi:POMGNT1 [Symbiodinium natans]|uniref:alpha-1,3-mannosyl-glycoprotein 2-beta-N-acetylglucosaminyltransferase n=1 Tax=Symbiodinium natans TaxID=878477 RepID=A0A812U012_9DINO|nr:POMGNT1 [Symbiodinium natans]
MLGWLSYCCRSRGRTLLLLAVVSVTFFVFQVQQAELFGQAASVNSQRPRKDRLLRSSPDATAPNTVPDANTLSTTLHNTVDTTVHTASDVTLDTTLDTTLDPLVGPACDGELSRFIKQGFHLPVLLLAHRRAERLLETLTSLAAVRGFSADEILISQDGSDEEVAKTVDARNLSRVTHDAKLRGTSDWKSAALRIARHYRWSIDAAFKHFNTTPGIIIVEDDLRFAPDFLEYFQAVAPVLDCDSSLWIVSAWNDNGFDHLVGEAKRLLRTHFLPGLGWLMLRRLWKELQPSWPDVEERRREAQMNNWDHWLRSPQQHQGRSVLYPQVPRVYHHGSLGTFMNLDTHRQYFQHIFYNQDPKITWQRPTADRPWLDAAVADARREPYEARIMQQLRHAETPRSTSALVEALASGKAAALAVWINISPEDVKKKSGAKEGFSSVAKFFGLWHEGQRAAHRGLHELWWGRTHVFLVNVHPKVGYIEGSWRADGRCASTTDAFSLFASCNPASKTPCCSPVGRCEGQPSHCGCSRCLDTRKMVPSYGHLLPAELKPFVAQDFAALAPPRRVTTRLGQGG